MSLNRVQLFLILGVSFIALHFTLRFAKEYFHYSSLQEKSEAHIHQWEIVPVKDRFALKANYGFEVQEKNWRGTFTLSPPHYLNEMAAFAALKEKAKEGWTTWYSPKDPQISALEKKFPTGLLIRSSICYGVLIYFLYLYKKLNRV